MLWLGFCVGVFWLKRGANGLRFEFGVATSILASRPGGAVIVSSGCKPRGKVPKPNLRPGGADVGLRLVIERLLIKAGPSGA